MLTSLPRALDADHADALVRSALHGLKHQPVRPGVVTRIGSAVAAGTYDAPVDVLVDRLVMVLAPADG